MRSNTPYARPDPVTEGGDTNKANARSRETNDQLRRLTREIAFKLAEHTSGILNETDAEPNLIREVINELKRLRSEFHNNAAEHEAIAYSYRIAAGDLYQQIIKLLDHWERQLDTVAFGATGLPAVHDGLTRVDRLQRILRRDPIDKQGAGLTLVQAQLEAKPQVTGPSEFSVPSPSSDMTSADVVARILGPLELAVDGRRILRWNSLRAKTLFQYFLINEGRPIRRDLLMELQWPSHTYSSARNNLNVALSHLRNTLQGPDKSTQLILYQEGCYRLNPELTWWIDRSEFLSILHQAHLASSAGQLQQVIDAYRRAVQLYRGPLFEDGPAGNWFRLEQGQLKEMYVQALERLSEIYCDLGELSAALQFGRLAINADRCRESAHRALMRCFALQNQRQLVSRQFCSCVMALRDELGVPPGDETIQLFRMLTSAT